MYLGIAEEQDLRRAELVKVVTDPILVFCGLFSATVAALVVVSMPSLQPNFQDIDLQTTITYLATLPHNLANALTHPKDTLSSAPIIDMGYTDFTPSYSSVLVNSFWLLSLLISLTCALMAISLQQWARLHRKVTSPRYTSLHEQARMRAFFAAGIERLKFEYILEALPVLIQFSFILFLAGFLLFMLDLSNTATVFAIACSWIGLCFVVYAYITFMPFFQPDSPFYTPLSNAFARLYAGLSFAVLYVLWSATLLVRAGNATREYFHNLKTYYRDLFIVGTMKLAEEQARQRSLKIDGDVLKRTLDGLSGDNDLGQFFEGVLGFCDSEMVKDPQRCLDILGRKRLGQTLEGFWYRTLSSDVISGTERGRRIVTCLKVINAACLSPDDLGGIFQSIEIGNSLRNFADEDLVPLARCMISGIISNAGRNDRWFVLAKDELGISEEVLRSYLAHGDSVLLANLIHFIRQVLHSLLCGTLDLTRGPLHILPLVSKLDILNTLPELQHEFCSLWHKIIQQAQNRGTHYNAFSQILLEIRHLYVALHPTDATPDHLSDAIRDANGGRKGLATHPTTLIATSHTFPGYPDAILATVIPSMSPFQSDPPDYSSWGSSLSDVPNIPQSLTPDASPSHSIPSETQVIDDDDNSYLSMTKPIPLSSSTSYDPCRPNERTMTESLSLSPINALSHSNPQTITISGPPITTSVATVCTHNGVQHLDLTINIVHRRRRAGQIRRLRA